MKFGFAVVPALAMVLVTSCSSGGGSPADGGGPDSTASCGGSADLCCNGTACNAGLTCMAGRCAANNAGMQAGDAGPGGSDSGTETATGTGSDAGAESGGSDSGGTDASGPDSGDGEAGPVDLGPQPPSCQVAGAGKTNCGNGSESCCATVQVPGGTYERTYTTVDGGAATGVSAPATIDTFLLDKYEVTVGRFRQYVAAGTADLPWTPSMGAGIHTHLNGGQGLVDSSYDAGIAYESGWALAYDAYVAPTTANLTSCGLNTWTPSPGAQENLPMNCVNWYEAYAFCIWDGGFLPSEAEWEYAGAGGSDQREYPWGSTDPGTASQYAIYGCWYKGTGGMSCSGVQNIGAVGTATLGVGRWGQLDLAGNVNEWTVDWFAPYVTPCVDCAYLTQGIGGRMVRGGDFINGSLLANSRSLALPPTDRDEGVGFRCARSP
jgi:formylglycine-generating enzyme